MAIEIKTYKPIQSLTDQQKIRFYNKVGLTANPGRCWEWKAALHKDGYGVLYYNYTGYLAHRVAYFISFDIDPKEMQVCHSCDNPKCVNPNHLFLGTHLDNIKDKMEKGRYRGNAGTTWVSKRNGSNVNTSKLNEKQVIEIRKLCEERKISQLSIGKQFNVGRRSVQNIFYKKHWKHI